MTEITKIKKLIKLCKEQGIERLKIGEIELVFGLSGKANAPQKVKPVEPKFVSERSSDPMADMPGDDEMLFFATDYFDELKKSREVS